MPAFEKKIEDPDQTPPLSAVIVTDGPRLRRADARSLNRKFAALARLFGLEVASALAPIYGSWLKRFFLRFKRGVTSDEVTKRLALAEDGVRALGVDKPRAESVGVYASAIADIMNSVGKEDSAPRVAFLMDTLLVMKYPGPDGKPTLICKQLTRAEQDHLNSHQELMLSPETLLNVLSAMLSAPRHIERPLHPHHADHGFQHDVITALPEQQAHTQIEAAGETASLVWLKQGPLR